MGLSSHELLQLAIGNYIDDNDRAAELVSSMKRDTSKDYEGKPYIEGFEHFSISHSDSSWAVLIDERECGLDIQYGRSCDFLSIARRFFNPEDAAAVGGIYSMGESAEAEARAEFFRIWTKREALIKALGLSVVSDDFPPVGLYKSAEYNGARFYIANIEMPGAPDLFSAICLDASKDINEKLIYKEMYVNKQKDCAGDCERVSRKSHAHCGGGQEAPSRKGI